MTNELYINAQDAFTTWGIGLEDKAIAALMTPSSMKDNIKNTSRLEHGDRVITNNPKVASRELTLQMHIYADTKTDFMAKYLSFCQELKKGRLVIQSTYIPDTYYRLDYVNCTQYAQYNGTMGLFSLRLNEPNPENRGLTSL